MPTLCSVIFAIIAYLFKSYASLHFLFRSVIWFSIEVLPDGGQQFTRHKLPSLKVSLFLSRSGEVFTGLKHNTHGFVTASAYCHTITVAKLMLQFRNIVIFLSMSLSLSLSPSLPPSGCWSWYHQQDDSIKLSHSFWSQSDLVNERSSQSNAPWWD